MFHKQFRLIIQSVIGPQPVRAEFFTWIIAARPADGRFFKPGLSGVFAQGAQIASFSIKTTVGDEDMTVRIASEEIAASRHSSHSATRF